MSAHWDKIVKLACKPKVAAPKAKYLDPIIATTYTDDNSLREVFIALNTRLRDPSAVVIHKALLVMHTMIRTGHTENVLGFLSGSSSDVSRLRQLAGGHGGGHILSENLSSYAAYLDSRIRGYRELKHDVIRIQNESNREDRMSGGDPSERRSGSSSQPSRSRTVVGKKLRQLTVEKGLLRETKGVQKQIDALLQCKFFLDSLDDELTLTTLRLLVKDLLILFQAGNEGVINILEHYFEMSAVDAEESLAIYKSFCVQTEGVVEYLSIARKLSNLLNVPVPNLRHAPTKLAGALEEYLRDPNFEQNRIEYKTNKALADGKLPNKAKPQAASATSASSETPKAAESSSKAEAKQTTPHKKTVDLLESIEESQPTMFNPQTNSPSSSWFHQQQAQAMQLQAQQTGFNPFRQPTMIPQMTGFQPQPFVNAQLTGFPMGSASPFVQPQATGMPFMTSASPFAQQSASPFAQSSPSFQQPFQQPVPTAMVQPQQTGFLVPQQTGSNPFRQSMAFSDQPRSASATTFPVPPLPTNFNSNTQEPKSQSAFAAALINRPASTPITSSSSGQTFKPVVSHQTGSRNPFGQPKAPSPPPVPKPPTLAQLTYGAFGTNMGFQPMSTPTQNGTNGINGTSGGSGHNSPFPGQSQPFSSQLAAAIGTQAENPSNANMSSVASSFTLGSSFNNANGSSNATSLSTQPPVIPQLTSQTTSTSGLSDAFSSLSFGASSNATSTNTNPSSIFSSPLQPQATGFAGLKAFKPTSSFGASLMESLPPASGGAGDSNAPSSGVSTPTTTNGPSSQAPSFTLTNFSNSASTSNFGNTVGVGLRPQMTGGAANPFRASMAAGSTSPGGLSGFSGAFGNTQQPASGLTPSFTGVGGFGGHGSNLFSTGAFKPSLPTIPSFTGAFPNASSTPTQQFGQPQQHQQAQPNSLI